MTNADNIRQSLIDLGNYQATNRQVANHCNNKYGFLPSPQAMYEAIGSEKDRMASTYDGRELMDLKKYVKKKWSGDINRLQGAIDVVKTSNGLV